MDNTDRSGGEGTKVRDGRAGGEGVAGTAGDGLSGNTVVRADSTEDVSSGMVDSTDDVGSGMVGGATVSDGWVPLDECMRIWLACSEVRDLGR